MLTKKGWGWIKDHLKETKHLKLIMHELDQRDFNKEPKKNIDLKRRRSDDCNRIIHKAENENKKWKRRNKVD